MDFNDLKTNLKDKGYGLLGIGIAREDETILEAVQKAICSPLLDTKITGASNILLNTSGKVDLNALNEAVSYVREQAGENVNVFWETVSGEADSNDIVVTVIATGMKHVTPGASTTAAVPNKESLIGTHQHAHNRATTNLPNIIQNHDISPNGKSAQNVPISKTPLPLPTVRPAQLQIPEFLQRKI